MLYFRGNQINIPWEKATKKPEGGKSPKEVMGSDDQKSQKKESRLAVSEQRPDLKHLVFQPHCKHNLQL